MIPKNLSNTAQQIISDMEKSAYICLQGKYWDSLWKTIPNYQNLPKPLILGGWWTSSDADKKASFLLHIIEADNRGAIEKVARFLKQVPVDAWYKGQ